MTESQAGLDGHGRAEAPKSKGRYPDASKFALFFCIDFGVPFFRLFPILLRFGLPFQTHLGSIFPPFCITFLGIDFALIFVEFGIDFGSPETRQIAILLGTHRKNRKIAGSEIYSICHRFWDGFWYPF